MDRFEIVDDLTEIDLGQSLSEDELFSLFDLDAKGSSKRPPKEETEVGGTDLSDLSWEDFEALVELLYQQLGYSTEVTQRTRDGGIDVWARRYSSSGDVEVLVIQAKHWQSKSVGIAEAQRHYGVVMDNRDVTKGVLVTSGGFSTECRRFAEGKGQLELIDGTRLRGLARKHGLL